MPFHLTRVLGVAPAAMLFNEMTTKIALGAVVTRAPAMTDFDRDPLALIETGDWVTRRRRPRRGRDPQEEAAILRPVLTGDCT